MTSKERSKTHGDHMEAVSSTNQDPVKLQKWQKRYLED